METMVDLDFRVKLSEVVELYPDAVRDYARRDVERQYFHVTTVTRFVPSGGRVADIGGGVSAFSAVCAALGYQSVLVDDFQDPVNIALGDASLQVHKALGVEILSRDVLVEGLGLAADSMDLIATFDSMEHWHNSPKALFADVVSALRPGGWFFMGVPNAVNLRKRITCVLGRNKWSQMADWYEQPIFRGHVREPDVDDLLYIAADMGLEQVSILGRNWLGYRTRRAWAKALTPKVDGLLRYRPTLCSDIYLLGRKPASSRS